ncbi:oligosaccharide flippase family protein [Clostridium sp.]|uniref:oligosaccharide flippase family protein n=1 Tax=Clostridium sp. TaxID=1506 RepID=UPI0039935327
MSIKKNIFYNIVYQTIIIILPLITFPYISRVVGVKGIGIYSYSYSIVSYFMLLVMLGVTNYGNRNIATVKDNKDKLSNTFWDIYLIQLISGTIMIILYIIYIIFFLKDNQNIAWVQGIYLLAAIFDINWLFFGMEKFKITVSRNVIIKILSVICIFIFVKEKSDIIIYTFIMASSHFLSNFILWFFLKKYIYSIKINIKRTRKHIKPNLILFIPVIAVSIYKIMDKVMLGQMTNMIQVGYYENTEKIINIPMGIITAIGTVMLPRMSNLISKGNIKKSEMYIEKSIQFVMFMSCAITFGLMAIGPEFILIFFGEEFSYCGTLIIYLAPTVIFISWANVIRTQYLIPNKKDNIYIKSVFLGAIVNLTINITLIPKYKSLGAIIGTIIAELSVMLYQTIYVKNELAINKYIKKSIIFLVSGIVMYVSIININYKFSSTIVSLIFKIILGAIIYLSINGIYFFIKDKQKNKIFI